MANVQGKPLIRVFVSVDMPEIVKKEIRKIQTRLRKLDLFEGAFVDPEIAHLTLKFIGYIEPIALPPIKKMLSTVEFAPMNVRLGNIGAVGNNHSIRIIWLDIAGEATVNLAQKIEKSLSLGPILSRKSFQAHVTLVRVKKTKDAVALRHKLREIAVAPITFQINKFVLKQSTLTTEGPVYVELEAYDAKE